MKYDEATTELLGFLLIFTLVLSGIALVTAVYLPLYIEETERLQNEEALASFLSFNRDLTTLCLAEEVGVQRKNILPAVSLHQDARLSLTYGAVLSGTSYREGIITYEIDNLMTDDFTITLSKRGLRLNGEPLAPSAFRFVVDAADTFEQMESDAGRIWIVYTYQGSFVHAGDGITYHILSVRMT